MKNRFYILLLGLLIAGFSGCQDKAPTQEVIDAALANGRLANEAFARSRHFVEGWLTLADSTTGLIPRNVPWSSYWNANDAAADNYPYMVLASYFTSDSLYNGRMLDMLNTEIRLTSCLGACPATFDFTTQSLQNPVDTGSVIFGSAEYMKDGLLPITEMLGRSPWSDRMISILDDLHKLVEVVTDNDIKGYYFGDSQVIEVNGDLLQVLSRVYWMTGNERYLDWAIRIGDYYLLEGNNPVDLERLRLRDHGCEILLGLCELYATTRFARPEKYEAYKEPLHNMLNRVLEVGRNEHGLFYDEINPRAGTVLQAGVADTWGYTFDGYWTVYELDGVKEYREALLKLFASLWPHYRNHDWEGGSMDGYADAIESALNLYNREPSIPQVADWIDSEMQVLYSFQKPNGIIEGWHGDGNFARTSIMYALWKTRGTHLRPWRDDVVYGAVDNANGITIALQAADTWQGKLCFDYPRWRDNLRLPMDWARINQWPQWFTADSGRKYVLTVNGKKRACTGAELRQGIDLTLLPGEVAIVQVREK